MRLKIVVSMAAVFFTFFIYSPGSALAQTPLSSSCVVGDRGSFIVDFKSSLSPFVPATSYNGGSWNWSSQSGGVAEFKSFRNAIANMEITNFGLIGSINKVTDIYLDELDMNYWVNQGISTRGQVYVFLKNGTFYKVQSVGAGTNYADFSIFSSASPVDKILFSSSDTRYGTFSHLMDNFQVNWTCKTHNRPTPTPTSVVPTPTSPFVRATATSTPFVAPTPTPINPACMTSATNSPFIVKDGVFALVGTASYPVPVQFVDFGVGVDTSASDYLAVFDVEPHISIFPIAGFTVRAFNETTQFWESFGTFYMDILTGLMVNGNGIILTGGGVYSRLELTSISAPIDNSFVQIDRVFLQKINCAPLVVPSATLTATVVPPPGNGTATVVPPPGNGTATVAPPPGNGTATVAPPPGNGTATVAPPPGNGTATVAPTGTSTPFISPVITGTLEAPYTVGLCQKEIFNSTNWACDTTGGTFQWLGCTIGSYFAPIRYGYDMVRVPIAAGRYGSCQFDRLVTNGSIRFLDVYTATVGLKNAVSNATQVQMVAMAACSVPVASNPALSTQTVSIGCSVSTFECSIKNVILGSSHLNTAWTLLIAMVSLKLIIKSFKMLSTGSFQPLTVVISSARREEARKSWEQFRRDDFVKRAKEYWGNKE